MLSCCFFFFFKQKTAYEMRISDWSSDVCSSDLKYKHLVFVIAAAYAGLAGGLLGVLQGYMPPEAFTFDTSGQLVMQTVIGGLGTLFGPLVGATVWLYLRDFLQGPLGLGASWKLALGIILVLLVCFRSEERRVGKEWVSTGSARWAR